MDNLATPEDKAAIEELQKGDLNEDGMDQLRGNAEKLHSSFHGLYENLPEHMSLRESVPTNKFTVGKCSASA